MISSLNQRKIEARNPVTGVGIFGPNACKSKYGKRGICYFSLERVVLLFLFLVHIKKDSTYTHGLVLPNKIFLILL